jgi:hypothetical protein
MHVHTYVYIIYNLVMSYSINNPSETNNDSENAMQLLICARHLSICLLPSRTKGETGYNQKFAYNNVSKMWEL